MNDEAKRLAVDCLKVFDEIKSNEPKGIVNKRRWHIKCIELKTTELIDGLCALPDNPWKDYKRGYSLGRTRFEQLLSLLGIEAALNSVAHRIWRKSDFEKALEAMNV